MTGDEIVVEARRWIGTPFAHQARSIGVGVDCGGLIGGVAVALGIVPADWWETTFDAKHAGYCRQPNHGRLQSICDEFMDPLETGQAICGDVVLIRFHAEPQHLGFLADYRHGGVSLIHALSSVGRVCEHRLSPRWSERVVSAYRMPGVV